MKKFICIFLSFAVLFSSGIFLFACATAQNVEEISAEEFATEVSGMIKASADSVGLPGNENNFNDSEDEFKTARLIVKSRFRIDTYDAISVICGFDDLWVLQYSSSEKAQEAYNNYFQNSKIEFVEIDKEVKAVFSESQSESFSLINKSSEKQHLSWGPEYIGADLLNQNIQYKQMETYDTIVAVVDTGVDPDHPFLKGRVLPTRINTSTSGTRNDSMDDNGHGTQIAGVIADTTLENVFIQPYKVLDKYGVGTLISLAAGINCAVEDKVDVINISAGFLEESEVLKNAIDNAEINDIIVVGASGNDGTTQKYYPASYDNVLKVTAINKNGIVMNFSTYDNGVDFAAPGYEITTTTLNGEYVKTRGTSIASPFVAAIAATIISFRENASREEIIEILKNTCIKVNEHNSELKYGNGIIRAPEQPDKSKLKEVVETPYFSHKTSFSQTELDIEIFCDTPGAKIYYTTDRSVPIISNPNAILYDGTPIHASQTVVLTAAAYCDGMYRSAISTFASIIAPYLTEDTLIISPDGTLTSYSGTATSFTIPEKVNGIEVKAIGESVFADKNVTEVVLPKTVTRIDNYAFNNCTQLKTIFGSNVTVVGDYSFNNCEWLKNILLLSNLTSIGKYSFCNAGKKQNLFTGNTFTLDLSKLTTIPEGAFKGSAISAVESENVKSITSSSFSGCDQLVSVKFDKLLNIPVECFKECVSLTEVEIKELSYISAAAFKDCKNLLIASFPDVRNVFSNAFENCVSLTEIGLPSAKIVYSNAFIGCTDLKILNLPEMESFEDEIYTLTNPQIYFPANLERFYAPKLKETVRGMFRLAPDIEIIGLNGAEKIAVNTFENCNNVYSLNIESVKNLEYGVFNRCSITFIDARNLVTTADMPDNSGILLSNNFVESTNNAQNLTVYGTKNTFVERYANLKGYTFVEIPLIYSDIPEFITENSETVYILAAGFDLTYQWYWNTKPETSGGTAIEGATTQSYTFTNRDSAPYYYCEITQNDLGTITKITTNIITKDTVPADYTAYNEAVNKANSIDRDLYTGFAELDSLLNEDVSGRYSCEQEIVDAQTQAILDAIDSLELKIIKSIDLYVYNNNLTFLETERIISVIQPNDTEYKDYEWISDNEDVILVSSNGRVRCIGEGSATVILRIENIDGSFTEGSIIFECNFGFWERIAAFLLKDFFKLIYRS